MKDLNVMTRICVMTRNCYVSILCKFREYLKENIRIQIVKSTRFRGVACIFNKYSPKRKLIERKPLVGLGDI